MISFNDLSFYWGALCFFAELFLRAGDIRVSNVTLCVVKSWFNIIYFFIVNRLRVLLVMRTFLWRFAKRSKDSLPAVCLFFLGSIIPAQAVVWNKDVTEAEVLEMARPMTSVVNIKIWGGNGSGVLLPSGKHVLTAKHVIMNPVFDIFGYEQSSARVYVTMEDGVGGKTETMVKGVYLHPSGADIAIVELLHPVAELLDEDGNRPAITPSTLSRDDP